jgi:hydroxyethylthiazole kinase-like uncharacterized protein yjeF
MSDLYGVERLPLPRAREMAEIDRRAREEHDVPERLLMESAGRAIAQCLQHFYPEGRVAAAVGSGHNGGDAYIALRVLHSWGREVLAVQAGSQPPDPVLAHRWDVPVLPAEKAARAFSSAAVILDGVLGTGTTGKPHEQAAKMIDAMNASNAVRVAVDGPSGMDFSTGAVPGACVYADLTVTLGFPKLGLLFQPARGRCGRIVAAEIGFQPVLDDEVSACVITPDWARAHLPRRAPDAAADDPAEVTRTGSWLKATTEGAPLKRTAARSWRAAHRGRRVGPRMRRRLRVRPGQRRRHAPRVRTRRHRRAAHPHRRRRPEPPRRPARRPDRAGQDAANRHHAAPRRDGPLDGAADC